MIYIGIDPGQKGGIGVITDDSFVAYPYTDEKLKALLDFLNTKNSNVKAVVEKVGARPAQGVVSTFKFGMNYGIIIGMLKYAEVPFELVTPQKWKKEFSLNDDKKLSIETCRKLFPGVNLLPTPQCRVDNDGMAEGLLIAEYARRHMK